MTAEDREAINRLSEALEANAALIGQASTAIRVVSGQALSVTEAANYLGCDRKTVDRLRTRDTFPGCFKVGAHWKIPVEDLQAYRHKNQLVRS